MQLVPKDIPVEEESKTVWGAYRMPPDQIGMESAVRGSTVSLMAVKQTSSTADAEGSSAIQRVRMHTMEKIRFFMAYPLLSGGISMLLL